MGHCRGLRLCKVPSAEYLVPSKMPINSFREIIAWQKAKLFTAKIYRTFGSVKDYGFKDQIQRAAVSIMNNIAEGFERRSPNEFKRFLLISKGSCAEVDSMLELALELRYISPAELQKLSGDAREILKMLHGLIASIRTR